MVEKKRRRRKNRTKNKKKKKSRKKAFSLPVLFCRLVFFTETSLTSGRVGCSSLSSFIISLAPAK